MKTAISTILCLLFLSYSYCQTNESLRNYFFPKTNKADTLYFNSQFHSYSDNKKVVKYLGVDTIEVLEFDTQNEFNRSYTYLISDKEVKVLSSKTNLNGKQIIDNKILGTSWLKLTAEKNYYDGRCEDTMTEINAPAKGYWELEYRQQISFKFDSLIYQNKKRKALIVNYENYTLNQPRFINAKVNFIDFKETMIFIEEIGLIKIKQKGVDHIHPNFSYFIPNLKTKKKEEKKSDYSFSNVIELRPK
jgi:hypothetical protein